MNLTFLEHELVHIVLTLLAISIFYLRYKSLWSIVMGILGGILVDIDHLFDYFRFSGFKLNFHQIVSSSYFTDSGKVFVFFHGWEYVLLFVLSGKIFKKGFLFYPLAVALFFHLVWDQVSYTANPFAYSIIFRFLHNFDIAFFNGF